VPAARAFGVKGVDGAALEGGHRVFDKARLVERVGVDGHLRVGGFGHAQAVVNRCGRGAPVFVQLQANGARIDLFVQRRRQSGIAFAQKTQVHRKGVSRLHHAFDVERAGRAGGGKGAGGRARAAAQHGGHAAGQCLVDLLGGDEMDVAVDAACRHDQAFAADDLGARANDDVHARLRVGVARLAHGGDAVALEANIGFDDAPMVDDERIGQHAVHRTFGVRSLRLRHAITDRLAAAELDLFAVATCQQGEVFFDLDEQGRIGQANPVAHGGAEHFGVSAFVDVGHVSCLSHAWCRVHRWSGL